MQVTDVRFFLSRFRGAPPINGQAASLITALDACLIDGFGDITPLSVTVADGIATATVNVSDTFEQHATIQISGSATPGLNGLTRVLTSSSDQITFATTAADGTASGTISIKYAPVGHWEKVFDDSGTGQKAVYQSKHPASLGYFLRVDDSVGDRARVVAYADMTDLDTGVVPFPDPSQVTNGYWLKSSASNALATNWGIFADPRTVYLAMQAHAGGSANGAPCRGFGDMAPVINSDTGACAISVSNPSLSVLGPQYGYGGFDAYVGSGGGIYAPHRMTGASGATSVRSVTGSGQSGHSGSLGAYPSPVNAALYLSKIELVESSAPRMTVPGVYFCPQSGLANLWPDYTMVGGPGGRPFIGIRLGDPNGPYVNSEARGAYFIDPIGPWRGAEV